MMLRILIISLLALCGWGCGPSLPPPPDTLPPDTPFAFVAYPFLIDRTIEDSTLGVRFSLPKFWNILAANQLNELVGEPVTGADSLLVLAAQEPSSLAMVLVLRRTKADFLAETQRISRQYATHLRRWAPQQADFQLADGTIIYQSIYFDDQAGNVRILATRPSSNRGVEFAFRLPIEYLARPEQFEPWHIEIVSAVMATIEWLPRQP